MGFWGRFVSNVLCVRFLFFFFFLPITTNSGWSLRLYKCKCVFFLSLGHFLNFSTVCSYASDLLHRLRLSFKTNSIVPMIQI